MARLLIVDDEKNIRSHLATFFSGCGHAVRIAESGRAALAALTTEPADLVLTDFRMAELNGLELLERIRRQAPDCAVILMTAYATVEHAVNAMKAGAQDYIAKPFSLTQIQHVVERALELRRLRTENQALRDTLEERPLLESKSGAMRRLLEVARQASASEASILLTGESGTGKNVLARQIHRWSARGERAFVVVNCTTLSEHLLESELFGHMRGAFTGAVKDKPGRLEAADKGTVFFDEIGDLPPALQTKLLRFVQEQSFERVGGDRTMQVDARIIAATNSDLKAEVAGHRFREDLYYRLNVIALHAPPLRERREDISGLSERILEAACLRNRRARLEFAAETAAALMRHDWPGNIRELRNAIERAVVLAQGASITPEFLPDTVFGETSLPAVAPRERLDEVEREHIIRVLAQSPTLEDAAGALGINVATLWRKRKRYKLD